MVRKLGLTITLLFIILCLASRERVLVRIPDASPALLREYQLAGADIAAFSEAQYLDLVWPQDEMDQLRQRHPDLEIRATEAQIISNLHSRDIPGYRTYQEMVDELYYLESQYPGLLQLEVIGNGWGKQYAQQGLPNYQSFSHDLYALKLSANVEQNEDEPAFYFIGAHHAREPLSMEVCMGILQHLLDAYGIDPEITAILDSSQIWFVPLMNPDGHKIVLDQTDIWWRKNLRDNNDNGNIDTANYGSGLDGVDINRNYSHEWGNISASDNPYDVTYHGPNPFSEPETTALKALLESRRFLAGISYHTYGEWVLYPYGYASNLYGPDVQELGALATAMAATIPGVHGGYYTPSPSFGLYPVSGSFDDWSYGTRGTFSYTIEMADQFIPPASQVPTIVQNNLSAARMLLQRKDRKVLRGHISDAATRSPLQAEIIVQGIDDHYLYRAPYASDADFGAYWRFLPEGTHTVRFVCEGYLPQSHTVQISPEGQTILDVAMIPAARIDQVIRVVDDIGNPVANAQVTVNDGEPMLCDINGTLLLSDIPAGEYRLRASASAYGSIDCQVELMGFDLQVSLTANALFMDGFETGTDDWQSVGWGISNMVSHSGTSCLTDSPGGNYANNQNTSAITIDALNLEGYESINLQFWAKWDFANDGDNCTFGYRSTLGGDRTIRIFQGTQDWTKVDLDLGYLAAENPRFYFKLSTTSGGTADGIYIDDFVIHASSDFLPVSDATTAPLGFSYGPNPFREQFRIDLTKGGVAPQEIDIYNIKGQKVRAFTKKSLTADAMSVTWDGRDDRGNDLASGIYFLRLTDDQGRSFNRKILRLK